MTLVRTCAVAMLVSLLVYFVSCSPQPAVAAEFPALSGRVVDEAKKLKFPTDISSKLIGEEVRSTNQVVVAVLTDLRGSSVEDYAQSLFKHWRLGQKGKDNGVLVLVSVKERKIRIHTGYGLEARLTDAKAKMIITDVIAPKLKKGDFDGGLYDGVLAILSELRK